MQSSDNKNFSFEVLALIVEFKYDQSQDGCQNGGEEILRNCIWVIPSQLSKKKYKFEK